MANQRMRTVRAAMAMAVLAAQWVGCSEGGGGDTAAGAAAATPTASQGPIAGFGSVIVNGVRWNTDAALFEIDGGTGVQGDLALGMVVRVEGERFTDGTARADRVIFESRLRGPVRRIDVLGPDARALEIFGIRAIVSRAGTTFDGADLSSLVVDTVVELSGFVNGSGELEVTHLRRRSGPVVNLTEVKLFGVVSGLAGGSFVLGTSEVRFDGTTILDDFGPGGLREGLEVRVEGVLLANDAVAASEIESPRRGRDDRFDRNEIQGIVSDFVSVSDFRVAGQPVDASAATFEPNDLTLLREGVRVEVEGRIDALGILIAEKVKFRSNRVRVHAEVLSDDDVDVAADRIWLLGIPIDLDRATRVRDQRDDLDGFDLSDVRAGDFLEVRGIARSDGRVIATRFERDARDDVLVRGPVDRVDDVNRVFTILGLEIPTAGFTVFEADDERVLSEVEFYERVRPGIIVQAKDREDGDETDFDVANEVEIEEPELEDDDRPDDPFGDDGGDDSESGDD